MTERRSHKLFLNLPVRDLTKTMDFFAKLGFTFNKQFTNENAACMVLSDEGFVMLLSEPFFKTFTKKEICDSKTHVEGIFALSADNREGVDQMVNAAIAAGGTEADAPKDYGFMYQRSFFDLDGHHWEVFYMDQSHVQPT